MLQKVDLSSAVTIVWCVRRGMRTIAFAFANVAWIGRDYTQ